MLFAVDVVVQLTLAEDCGESFQHQLLDVASVALSVFRPLRLLWIVALATVVQRAAGHSLRGTIATCTGDSAALGIWVAVRALLHAGRHAAGASTTDIPKALWWAFVSVMSVGHGDLSPVTTAGPVLAVALMIGVLAVLGVVPATRASWIVSGVSAEECAAARGQVAELQDQPRQFTDLMVRPQDATVCSVGN